MPDGVITNTTPANTSIAGTDETTFLTRILNRAPLIAGTNLLAVEIHQNTATSSDLLFNFELTASVVVLVSPSLRAVHSGTNLVFTWPADPGVFSVYTATNLISSVTWLRVTNAPQFSNGQWTVSLAITTNAACFYRLQSF